MTQISRIILPFPLLWHVKNIDKTTEKSVKETTYLQGLFKYYADIKGRS